MVSRSNSGWQTADGGCPRVTSPSTPLPRLSFASPSSTEPQFHLSSAEEHHRIAGGVAASQVMAPVIKRCQNPVRSALRTVDSTARPSNHCISGTMNYTTSPLTNSTSPPTAVNLKRHSPRRLFALYPLPRFPIRWPHSSPLLGLRISILPLHLPIHSPRFTRTGSPAASTSLHSSPSSASFSPSASAWYE